MALDKPLHPVVIPLNGKLKLADDALMLGPGDFQTLQNFRYTDTSIKGIRGTTKLNTTAVDSGSKIVNGFHFQKNQPDETHVLIQTRQAAAVGDGGHISKVYDNITDIPDQGNFESTALWTDNLTDEDWIGTDGNPYSLGSDKVGRFSQAPDGCVAYCNGNESVIWGGNESRVAAFLNYSPAKTFLYDHTEKVNNSRTDSDNLAVIYSDTSNILDANTIGVWHFDSTLAAVASGGAVASSTFTAAGNAALTTSYKKFGAKSVGFDGTGDYLSIADNAIFTLGAAWTIDCWFGLGATFQNGVVYYQQTDATHYIKIELTVKTAPTRYAVKLTIVNGAATVTLESGTGFGAGDTPGTFHHIAVVKSSADYRIFIDGKPAGYLVDTDATADMTGDVFIGSDSTPSTYLLGYLDEFRISNIARWSDVFIPEKQAYGTSTATQANIYLGSIRPLSGFKFYVDVVNTGVSTTAMTVDYWNGTVWTPVSTLVDGTATASVTCKKTGSITFDSTVSTARPRIVEGIMAYWYSITMYDIGTTTTLSRVTTKAPMQSIKDLWDGVYRQCFSFQANKAGTYEDGTIQIEPESWVDGVTSSYMDVGGLVTGTSYLLAGFMERINGFKIGVAEGHANAVADTIMTVSYWDGTAWQDVANLSDGTLGDTFISLSKSGVIDWPVVSANEEKRTFNNSVPLYFYKIAFSKTLTAKSVSIEVPTVGGVYIWNVRGIPRPRQIDGYRFPVLWQNRLGLACNGTTQSRGKAKNTILFSAPGSVSAFNGAESVEYAFGDNTALTAAGSLYSRYTTSIYESLVVCKANSCYIVDLSAGNDKPYEVSKTTGCPAPLTFVQCDAKPQESDVKVSKHLLIWQTATSIVKFDSNSIEAISDDIKSLFDPNSERHIHFDYIDKSSGFFDPTFHEYHWLFADNTSSGDLNSEFVYDVIRDKWYEAPRSTNSKLQCGFAVFDSIGNAYTYGGNAAGFLSRLEYGNYFNASETVGTEVITNAADRNFESALTGWWTLGPGVEIVTEAGANEGLFLPSSGAGSGVSKTGVLTVGTWYRVVFTVCTYVSSLRATSNETVTVKVGDTLGTPRAKQGSGANTVYTEDILCTGTQTLSFLAFGNIPTIIDDLSVKPLSSGDPIVYTFKTADKPLQQTIMDVTSVRKVKCIFRDSV